MRGIRIGGRRGETAAPPLAYTPAVPRRASPAHPVRATVLHRTPRTPMLSTLAAALVLLQAQPADTTPRPAAPAPPRPASAAAVASAFRDPSARELVGRAREYRRQADRSVTGYQTLARQRVAVGMRALSRDRTVYRAETAARIDWRRDGGTRVEVLGAREMTPDTESGIPGGIRTEVRDLAFDPSSDRLRIGLDGSWVRHPLAVGSEEDYRFRAGDTLTVRLPGGNSVRVYELRVEPRHTRKPLVTGSLWLEDRSFGIVRSLLRLSHSLREEFGASSKTDEEGKRSITIGIDMGGDSARASRGRRDRAALAWAPDVRLDLRFMTTEYALVEGRWWMPASVALEGTMSAGDWITAPIRFERSYTQYSVQGDTAAPPGTVAVSVAAPADSAAAPSCREGEEDPTCVCRNNGRCRRVEVVLPADSLSLLASADLPEPYTATAPLLSGKEAGELAREIERVAGSPWLFTRPSLRQSPLLARYNRVEGLSLGTRGVLDFGPLAVDGTLRVATANWEPDVELGLREDTPEARRRLAVYRRLSAADPSARALSIGNSLNALLFGRDDGDYFRALGVELAGSPPRSERQWLAWRLFAERQRRVGTEADFSFRDWVSESSFRPNIRADRADQIGAAATLRPFAERTFLGTTWNAELGLEGQTGDFRFGRSALTVRAGLPLPGKLVGALEGSAGTTLGDVPEQGLWRLGGPGSLRGYDASTATGTAFWRGRAEVGTEMRAARLALFTDAGWAGDRGAWTLDRPLWSVGAGASFMDGMLRLDVARGLRGDGTWRFDLYLDGTL